ncbi:MAG: hypothetical protein ACYCT7_01760 [bacterium]
MKIKESVRKKIYNIIQQIKNNIIKYVYKNYQDEFKDIEQFKTSIKSSIKKIQRK